jgi:hypothetical protein
MTLPEMLCFIALVVCVIMGAKLGHHIAGSWYGYLLGGILGIFVFLVCIYAFGFVLHLWSGTGLPKCRNGCCHGPSGFSNEGDYKIQEVESEFYMVCKCGDRYQRRGKQFVLVNEDGSESPYLIWRRFRGWFPDVEQKGNRV